MDYRMLQPPVAPTTSYEGSHSPVGRLEEEKLVAGKRGGILRPAAGETEASALWA